MTPAAAKMLMCVCAGSTGAVMVPAVHKARNALHRPSAQHASAHTAAVPGNTMSSPCAPVASVAPLLAPIGAMPAEAGIGSLGQLADNSAGATASAASYGYDLTGGGYGPYDGNEGGFPGGVGGGGAGGGGAGGGGPGGGIPGAPATGPVVTPISGAVPEPASWAMLATGFGAMGGAIRWQRRATA